MMCYLTATLRQFNIWQDYFITSPSSMLSYVHLLSITIIDVNFMWFIRSTLEGGIWLGNAPFHINLF